jgi:GAF domain-containing protein
MIGWAISNHKARIALDVGSEAVRFNNPNLPLTRSEIAIPIIARENVLGAMTVQSSRPNAFDENDITVLQGIADSLGTALDNDRLFKETRQNLEEIRALNREYLQRAWAETINLHGGLGYTFENPAALNQPTSQVIEVPVILRDEVIGYLSLETDHDQLTEEEQAFVENITNQTAIALENARLLEETERRAVQEQKINELATRFSRALSIEEILRAAVQELGQLPSVAEVSVRLAPTGLEPAHNGSAAPHLGSNGNGKEPVA